MKLYYAPGACSLAPHIIAAEAGLDLGLEKVDLGQKRTEAGEDYRGINPKGAVPALQLDDGQVLTENAVVLQYLAAQAPERGFMPRESMARWRLLELVNFIATELHKGFAPLFKPDITQEMSNFVVGNLSPRLQILDRQLGDKPYLTGEAFTIADAYAFVILSWAKRLNIDISSWPRLESFRERVAARPAVRGVLAEEGLA
jgi:glutathione S-transferase